MESQVRTPDHPKINTNTNTNTTNNNHINNGDINNGNDGNINGVNEGNLVNGVMYVKVMTDEQLEILRTQIAVYTAICEQLVDLHRNITSHQDLSGVRLGNLYCDPLVTTMGHKITARQRWTPTPVQLQILEQIFDQGTGTPTKQKIKEITAQLSQHGQISETNVYNWFQNRRARSKRKQQNNAQQVNVESEVETDAESPKEKKLGHESFQSQQCQEMGLNVHGKMEPVFGSDDGSKVGSNSMSQLAFYESILQNPRVGMDQLIGKMEVPGTYNAYQTPEDYSMSG